MFDEFGPRGAEDEREGFWTDLSEVPDEQYRDEDEPKQTQEVIVPPAQEPYGPGIVPPEEKKGRLMPVFGMVLVTTAILSITCIPIWVVIPTAISIPNRSFACRAMV